MYSKKHYASNDVPLKILWHLMYRAFGSVEVGGERENIMIILRNIYSMFSI